MALSLSLVGGLAQAAGPELVQNGGFETGDFTGWTTTPSDGASLFGVDAGPPRNGSYSAYFGGLVPYDTISQTFSTNVGASYKVSFFLEAVVDETSAGFIGAFGSTELVSLTEADGSSVFQAYNFDVLATSTTTTLSFAAYNNYFFYTLDDVSVTAVTTPVPEPGSYALMALGLMALGIAVRRRSSVAD